MKKKHVLMAIGLGAAIGLYIGVNVDLDKSNISKVVGEIERCVKKGFGEEEAWHYHDHEREKGTYEIQDSAPKEKEGTILCENAICLPPSERNGQWNRI
jgi:hypothetical protein